MLRLIEVFAAVFFVEPDGVIGTMIVFFSIIFNFISVCVRMIVVREKVTKRFMHPGILISLR